MDMHDLRRIFIDFRMDLHRILVDFRIDLYKIVIDFRIDLQVFSLIFVDACELCLHLHTELHGGSKILIDVCTDLH